MPVERCPSCDVPLTRYEAREERCPVCRRPLDDIDDYRAPRRRTQRPESDYDSPRRRDDYAPPARRRDDDDEPVRQPRTSAGMALTCFAGLVGLALLGLMGFGAYVLAEYEATLIVLAGGFFIGVALTFASMVGTLSQRRSRRSWTFPTLAIFFLFLMLDGTIVSLVFHHATVHVDNASAQHVRILVDGKEWLSVPPNGRLKKGIMSGTHRVEIRAVAGDNSLDEQNVTAAGFGQYVLNVLGAQTYWTGTVHYRAINLGVPGFGGPHDEVRPKTDKWFKIEVDYLFQEPPIEITLGKNKTEATKTFLLRNYPQNINLPQPPMQMPKIQIPNFQPQIILPPGDPNKAGKEPDLDEIIDNMRKMQPPADDLDRAEIERRIQDARERQRKLQEIRNKKKQFIE